MSNTIKAFMVLGVLAVVAACQQAPAEEPSAEPMVAAEPTSGKM